MVDTEICSCGHLKTQHNPEIYYQINPSIHNNQGYKVEIEGHGNCKLCGCEKFTWVATKKLEQ